MLIELCFAGVLIGLGYAMAKLVDTFFTKN